MTNWTQKTQEILNEKTENYTSQEKSNVNFEYLKNLLIKIEDNHIPQSELLCSKMFRKAKRSVTAGRSKPKKIR